MPNLDQSFTYDPDMRLLSAIGAYGTQTFAYDADGNRLSESFTQRYGRSDNTRTGSYAYDTASNMLQSVSGLGGMQYTYTSNGNLAREANGRTDRSFTYDARNRLSSLTNQGMSAATVRYKTNALGERVQKSGASDGLNDFDDATDYIYDEQGHLIAEGHDGRISREYIYLGSLPVAELTHGQVYYIHDNHLGAPQKLTDAQQRIVWDRISEPFGKTFALKGDQTLMNLRFPGQYHDAESGLDYNMFRSYDPSTGRYTQSDPIGLLGGINTYAYTENNPVNRIDQWGLDWVYSQSTGTLSHYNMSFQSPPTTLQSTPNGPNPNYVGSGYSGHGSGLNNPQMQNVPNTGPIPQGTYGIGSGHYSPTTGPNTMNLTPLSGTNTFGRDLFRIHGDNAAQNHTASEGCIVASPAVRNQVNNSNDHKLWVVP